MAKIKKVTTPNAIEDTKKPDHSSITSGNINCIATVGNSLAVS